MSLVPTNTDNDLTGDTTAPYALIQPVNRSVGTIMFDVTIREVLTDEDTITVFPVETGTPISDHVFANPKIIELSVASSDSVGGPGYCQLVYQAILAQKAQREPFDVYTGKRAYQNMLFGNVTVVTDEQSEYALMVTVRLQEVIITQTTDASGDGMNQNNQEDPSKTSPESNVGTQSLTPAPNASVYSDYEAGFSGGPSNTDAPL